MKRSTRRFTVVAAVLALVGFAGPAPATPIIYEVSGVATGTIGGAPFTNVLVTVTLTGDTSNVVPSPTAICPTCLVNLGSTTVNIPGQGTGTVTDPTAIFATVIPFFADVGFPVVPYVSIAILDNPPATDTNLDLGIVGSNDLLNYDLRTSIGPIVASVAGVSFDQDVVHTTLGDLAFTSHFQADQEVTFTATTVPAPSSLLLLGAGGVMLAGFRVRRQSR